jgi:hypothetical protein
MTDLDDALQVVRTALTDGRVGYAGLYSDNQSNYRDAWTELNRRVWARMNDGEFERYAEISRWMMELMERAPKAPEPCAENTTRYGSENG